MKKRLVLFAIAAVACVAIASGSSAPKAKAVCQSVACGGGATCWFNTTVAPRAEKDLCLTAPYDWATYSEPGVCSVQIWFRPNGYSDTRCYASNLTFYSATPDAPGQNVHVKNLSYSTTIWVTGSAGP